VFRVVGQKPAVADNVCVQCNENMSRDGGLPLMPPPL
jgi:hypothetical protein